MNKRGVNVLVQRHFILESTLLSSAISCWTRLGVLSAARKCYGNHTGPVHNPGYDFNDRAAVYGASFFASVVETALSPAAQQ